MSMAPRATTDTVPPELPGAAPSTLTWPLTPVTLKAPPAFIETTPGEVELRLINPAIAMEPSEVTPGDVAIVSEAAALGNGTIVVPACIVTCPARTVALVIVIAADDARITCRNPKFSVQLFPIVHGPV